MAAEHDINIERMSFDDAVEFFTTWACFHVPNAKAPMVARQIASLVHGKTPAWTGRVFVYQHANGARSIRIITHKHPEFPKD